MGNRIFAHRSQKAATLAVKPRGFRRESEEDFGVSATITKCTTKPR
jgi:hypothetical protein